MLEELLQAIGVEEGCCYVCGSNIWKDTTFYKECVGCDNIIWKDFTEKAG